MLHGYSQFLKEVAENVETRFNTSNYELDRPLSRGKNEKLI